MAVASFQKGTGIFASFLFCYTNLSEYWSNKD